MAESPTPTSPASSRRRFTLAGLLELIAGIGLLLALVSQLEWVGLGMALFGFLILAAVHHELIVRKREKGAKNVWGCLIVILVAFLVLSEFFPKLPYSRPAAEKTQCTNNLRQLALALHNYHDLYGHFPPPYIADDKGKPMHSWRVLILPHLGLDRLYQAYNLDEPWDGPNNSKLVASMPSVFRCPADHDLPPGMTSYFCITGPGRMKEGKAQLALSDITDGPPNTLALVESSSARVNWLEPRDLTVEDILAGENTPEAPCPCSRHLLKDRGMWRTSGNVLFMAAFFDADVEALRAGIDPDALKFLLTIDGGEPMTQILDSVSRPSHEEYLWPGFWVLLVAEVAFVTFAVVRRVRLGRRRRREVADG